MKISLMFIVKRKSLMNKSINTNYSIPFADASLSIVPVLPIIIISFILIITKGSRKKVLFIVVTPPPPPNIKLSGHIFLIFFSQASKRGIFSMWSGL